MTEYPRNSMISSSAFSAHDFITKHLLKRSPELSRTGIGFVYLVLDPIKKMQLNPKEKEYMGLI